MGRFMDILMWTIVAAIVFVVVTNGKAVAAMLTSFGGFWVQETGVLTGQSVKYQSS